MDLGFGRTGTMSLKHALEELGFSKCYHFSDMYDKKDDLEIWLSLSRGEKIDWERIFDGYQATVYWTPSYDYRDLLEKYQDIKVVLLVRDADKWYKSMYDTVYQYNRLTLFRKLFLRIMKVWKPELNKLYNLWNLQEQTLWKKTFKGRFHDKKFAIDIFNKHIEEVKQNVPSDRLLIYNIKEGWKPLCDFLQVPIPETDFPHVNDSSSFITWRNGVFKEILFGKKLNVW